MEPCTLMRYAIHPAYSASFGTVPSKLSVFTQCSAASFDMFLQATVDAARPDPNDVFVFSDTMKLEAMGDLREAAGLPGAMECLVTCFRMVEKLSDLSHEFLTRQLEMEDSYLTNLVKKFKTRARSIQVHWCSAPPYHRSRIRMSCPSIVAAINVFARCELDAPFEALTPLLSLVDFVGEFPRRGVAKMSANLIRFVNLRKPVPLWRLEYVDAVLPHLPLGDENAHKLIATICKIRLLKGAWKPEPPPAEVSWNHLGSAQYKLPCCDAVNQAYLRCFEAGVGAGNERAAAALYSYLLGRNKSLIFSAACFASSEGARAALLRFLDEHADEVPKERRELSRILCGAPVPTRFPFHKVAKEDVLRVSYELEYQGRRRDAAGLALVDAQDVAQQYRFAALRHDRKLFAMLERHTPPQTFDVAFWRYQAHVTFNNPASINAFWAHPKTAADKCRALLYVATLADTSGPAALAVTLKAFEILNAHKKDIPPWLYPVLRKQCLKIIVEKYAALGLVDWAIRYGYAPDALDALSPVSVVTVDDDSRFSDDALTTLLGDIADYLRGKKNMLQPDAKKMFSVRRIFFRKLDAFGILPLEQLLLRGNASEIEHASRKCLRRLWTAWDNLQDPALMNEIHPTLA